MPPTTGRRSLSARLVETVKFYGPLGFTAFGGPSANIVLIRKIFVAKEHWLDDRTFNDLLALGQALPGPAFSQLAFSISALRGGITAAMLSFVLLTAPGAIIMTGLGFGVRRIPDTLPGIVYALFTGLNAAAVGLVALAAYELSQKVVTDKTTRLLLFLSGAIAACYESQWLYPVLMAASGLTTFIVDSAVSYRARREARRAPPVSSSASAEASSPAPGTPQPEEIEMQVPRPAPVATKPGSSGVELASAQTLLHRSGTNHSGTSKRYPTPPLEDRPSQGRRESHEQSTLDGQEIPVQEETYFNLSIRNGLMIAGAFLIVLIVMLVVRGVISYNKTMEFATNLMLGGTIIFGGGPVVIPLLRGYVVDPGWVSPRDFLLLFALLQALPGPQFNLAAGLGVLVVTQSPIGGAILGVFCIFLPGIALKIAFLPLYQRWKEARHVRSVLRGLNAGAVGLIYSAVYRLYRVGYISADPTGETAAISQSLDQDGFLTSIVAGAFVACASFKVPTPVAILGGALAGMAWYGVRQA